MKISTSKQEIIDLIKSWIVITIIFTILVEKFNYFNLASIVSTKETILISALTVGIGFLLHELAHKVLAQNYGCWAEFRAFYNMLWLAILFSLFGFIIAAPGAVMIKGFLTKEKNGKISLAGPMTNIILAFLFFFFLLSFDFTGILRLFLVYGLTINSLLAVFNMIPFSPFDGHKVYIWNKTIYIIAVVVALGLFLSSFVI